jgi:hypothetical protein
MTHEEQLQKFEEEYSKFKSFADLSLEEQDKVLATGQVIRDPENKDLLIIKHPKGDITVEANKFYNKAWGLKDENSK